MKFRRRFATQQPWPASFPRLNRRLGALVAVATLAMLAALHSVFVYYNSRPLPQCLESMREQLGAHSRAALAADWVRLADAFNATAAPIPLTQLWQTSRSKRLSRRGAELRTFWTSLNPGMNASLMDDAEAAAFVRSFYGENVHAIYQAYPVAVMRADFWRYAVLYAYGGIYADIDTQGLAPVAAWFPPRKTLPGDPRFVVANASTWQAAGPLQYFNLTWDDCSLVAGLENDAHVCQWVIAAAAGHPVLRAALQVALRSVRNGFDCTYEHMVHAHTGPEVWTQAFRQVLGLPGASAHDISVAVWTNTTVYQRARQLKLCIMAPTFFGAPANGTAQNAQNHYSSQWAKGSPNTPWIKERQQVTAAVRRSAPSAQTSPKPGP